MVVPAIAEQSSETGLVHNDGLAVDDAGFDGKARDGVHDQRISTGKVIAVPRNELDLITVLPRQDAEAVVLDLMKPVGTAGRHFGFTRQARLNRSGGALEAAL